jgi:predicted transposase YdaD
MLNLKEADVTQTRFYQEVLELGRQKGLLFREREEQEFAIAYKVWRKIGRQIGWKEGRVNIVLRLLNRRCGQLLIAQKSQVRSLPITDIENLGEALLDFKGMTDLEI